MLAFAWHWDDAFSDDRKDQLAERLGASLCAGIGGRAGTAEISGLQFAYRPIRANAAPIRAWRPALLPGGRISVFHGYFDNAADIAAELAASPSNLSLLYGLAVDQWGDEAERRIIGEYCTIIADPENSRVRLARSPLRAPPLFYSHNDDLAAVASVPRAMFAAGVERQLNEVHVADSALINFTDQEASWFEGIARVPHGSLVELRRGKGRALRKWYDVGAIPDIRLESDADYVARAGELLNQGVRACLAGFRQPGATLSGGLDSPQVAVRALAALPKGQPLPTFTFHPEDGFDGHVERGYTGNERPAVEAFAAMHPGLEPHFTANDGYGHDHRWNDFFHFMGGAPSGLCNMYVMHGLFAGAAKRGCDVLLLAEWGNYTFSDKGNWGFVQYFLKGRWRQLWLALSRQPNAERSIFRRFLGRSIIPLLSNRLWHPLRRLLQPNRTFMLDLMQPLSARYRRQSGAQRRLDEAGIVHERYQPRSQRHAHALLFQNGDSESDEVYQAFEQMYGVPQRDPMAYRPFVEFCFGLPVDLFMRDGTMRWLAKEMGRGIMPEEQRSNRVNGRWDADWLLRIKRRQPGYLAELDQISADERLSAMLDVPRLRAALENLPGQTETDPQKFPQVEYAVPRGLLTARFVNWVEGRNQP